MAYLVKEQNIANSQAKKVRKTTTTTTTNSRSSLLIDTITLTFE
jgi:hypothetical protein